jgi:cysteine desulfuration protein SufE
MNKACQDHDDSAGAPASDYPPKLAQIVALFEGLPEDEKRETLISYADQAKKWGPVEDQRYDLEDVRKDEECTDTVGIFLQLTPDRNVHFRVSLGPQVQILTRAMTSILCKGLDGVAMDTVLDLSADFVPRIVGGQLVRARSQTVYYVLTRMKSACRAFLNRERAAASAAAS